MRQCLGVEAARFQFALTRHEALVFVRGNKTWWGDPQHNLWRTLGEKEIELTNAASIRLTITPLIPLCSGTACESETSATIPAFCKNH